MRHFTFLFYALFIFLGPCIFSMDWPSASGVMTGNFGLNDNGMPQLGISFADEGQLTAAESGELLYSRNEGDTASRLPSPLGAWAALDHGDGIISIYGRMDSRFPAITDRPEKGRFLGEAGISGWASQRGFYFQLFDRKERRWVNPAMIIVPGEDRYPPSITQIRLRDRAGNFIDLAQTRNISQGSYTVFVNAHDTFLNQNENPLAPYRIICLLNGSESGLLSFETCSARVGSLSVNRGELVPAKRVYAIAGAYETADLLLMRGQSTLEIIAQDIAGNVRNIVYRLNVE